MKPQSIISALFAGILSVSSLSAQSFCLDVGDGVPGAREQSVVRLIHSASSLAFVGTDGMPSEDMKTMVGKVSQNGSKIWSKSYDLIDAAADGNPENAVDVTETANGQLVIASAGATSTGIARINGSNGSLVHARTIPGFRPAYLRELPTDDIMVIGNRAGDTRMAAIRLDAALGFLGGMDLGIHCTPKKVIMVASGYYGVGYVQRDASIAAVTFALDNNLQVMWAREYEAENQQTFGNSLAVLPDGSILTVGLFGWCTAGNNQRLYLNRYTATGGLLKTVKISEANNCVYGNDILIGPNGTVILSGSYGFSWPKAVTWAFGADGSYLGAMAHSNGAALSLVTTPQGRVFWGGWHDLYPGRGEGLITRLLADGSSCCAQPHTFMIEESAETDIQQTPTGQTTFVLTSTPYVQVLDFGTFTTICAPSSKVDGASASMAQEGESTLSPNPAHDRIQLDLPGEGSSDVQLLDLHGRVRMRRSLPAGRHELPVADLESGVYLLRIQGAAGLRTHKLSIQH